MAAGVLPEPGAQAGPCVEACGHRDCAATRADAAAVCPRCEEPIGYGVRYYRADDRRLVHASCEEDAAEAERGRP